MNPPNEVEVEIVNPPNDDEVETNEKINDEVENVNDKVNKSNDKPIPNSSSSESFEYEEDTKDLITKPLQNSQSSSNANPPNSPQIENEIKTIVDGKIRLIQQLNSITTILDNNNMNHNKVDFNDLPPPPKQKPPPPKQKQEVQKLKSKNRINNNLYSSSDDDVTSYTSYTEEEPPPASTFNLQETLIDDIEETVEDGFYKILYKIYKDILTNYNQMKKFKDENKKFILTPYQLSALISKLLMIEEKDIWITYDTKPIRKYSDGHIFKIHNIKIASETFDSHSDALEILINEFDISLNYINDSKKLSSIRYL